MVESTTPPLTTSPPQSKPSSPPPAYTEVADPAALYPQSSIGAPIDGPHSPATSPFPTRTAYGPTPIQQQTQLLPYYDPRSPHAIAEANSRARWRFVYAFFWALVLLSFMSVVTGIGASLRVHGVRLGGWIHNSNRAEW